jgi:hypothetical protein
VYGEVALMILSTFFTFGVFSFYQIHTIQRNRTTTELVSAEIKRRLNSTFSCAEMHKHTLCNPDLLRAIKPDEK